jgi:3-hydroxybutyryl-CoA dehydrogenase
VTSPKLRVAVIGAGIMGSGIAQVAAMAGHDVAIGDVNNDALVKGSAAIQTSLARMVRGGKLSDSDAVAIGRGITYTADLAVVAVDAEVVIEAVPEVLDIKRDVLARAAAAAAKDALLATNTSQLSITALGASLGSAASRFIGIHFFNPPVMMRLAEIICGAATSDETLARARAFCEGLGKEVVICKKDSPGFLTSRAYAAFRLECIRMVEEGLASPEDIDTAFRLGFNFPMGPFELGDFNGVDTFVHVLDSLTAAYGDRFRPTPILRNMVAAGRLGKKTGKGWFTYGPDGDRITG